MRKVQSCLLAVFSMAFLVVCSAVKSVNPESYSIVQVNDVDLKIETDTFLVSQLANRKMCEILKHIKLKPEQIPKLFEGCYKHQKSLDSALILYEKPYDYGRKRYTKDSLFESFLYTLLTDSQTLVYIRNKGRVDVEIKTDEKMRYLEEAGTYENDELRKMRRQIFRYLMREKVVYTRDKYDIDKQKRNIQSLKNIQPLCLKEAETRRKLKNRGMVDDGQIIWKIYNEK